MVKLNLIICIDKNGGMAYKEKMPWNFPLEYNYFISKIKYNSIYPGLQKNILIMGRKTFIDFYRDDIHIDYEKIFVLTSQVELFSNNYQFITFVPDLESCLYSIKNNYNKLSDIWVIGGKSNYLDILKNPSLCGDIYVTEIDGVFQSDVQIDLKQFQIQWEEEFTYQEINKLDDNVYKLCVKKGRF